MKFTRRLANVLDFCTLEVQSGSLACRRTKEEQFTWVGISPLRGSLSQAGAFQMFWITSPLLPSTIHLGEVQTQPSGGHQLANGCRKDSRYLRPSSRDTFTPSPILGLKKPRSPSPRTLLLFVLQRGFPAL